MKTSYWFRVTALIVLGLGLAVSQAGSSCAAFLDSSSASIVVETTILGKTTRYIGATEGGSFDIDDLVDCGISSYRIWIGMSDVEYCDDNDPRGYNWGCDQIGNTLYGSPTIAEVKANPGIIGWEA